ncbi:MAG: translation initiation factor IF-2 [Bacteroidales bacterium]|nr:translation initiation factor IF-2 [Bacteroidales bacterium]
MTDAPKATRLSKAAREFNVGISTMVEFLHKKGFDVDPNPNGKVPAEAYELLVKEYSGDLNVKKESEKLALKELVRKQETVSLEKEEITEKEDIKPAEPVKKESTETAQKEKVTPAVEKPAVKTTEVKESADKVKDVSSADEPPKEKSESSDSVPKPELKIVGKIDLKDIKKPAEQEKSTRAGEVTTRKDASPKEQEEKKAETRQPDKGEQKADKDPEETSSVEKVEEKVTEKKVSEAGESKDVKEIKEKSPEVTEPPAPVKKEEAEVAAEHIEESEEAKKETPAEAEAEKKSEKAEKEEESSFIKTKFTKLNGPIVLGKIDLPSEEKRKKQQPPKKGKDQKPQGQGTSDKKRQERRPRIKQDKEKVSVKPTGGTSRPGDRGGKKRGPARPEVNEEDVQKQVKETLARLTSKGKSKGSKYRREKRDAASVKQREEHEKQETEKSVLKVTEFVSVNELATMMDTPVTQVISACMNLGLFVSINQRLDAETMALVAEEFDHEVEFVSAELQEAVREDEDNPEQLKHRPPIVTVMGHVDHGKTKLLDHIRKANVIAGEAGGITQHIGAYGVKLEDGRQITFLDTPGHEAFTAMRARGAQTTDIAIIVVAADDGVMPQTVEAINHASAAGVPIIFAINKIDKPSSNPERIKEELANMNFLVEDWGGKFQSQEISALNGINIEQLLEKILLEAEMLDLKANPDKRALGTVIESSLDKGRGYITTILVKSGTLKIGDVVIAGTHFGHVKAMYNERGHKIDTAGPSTPVLILGLNGAPQAGDGFNVMETDKEAKEIATKRTQLQREQGLRTQKHITLDEIGRRIAIGNFQELNIIVKGDVDGSVEALSDALIKLSTEEIQVTIRHKAVGQISESDVLLAAASNAIIVGFQVRPSLAARKLAEKEEIDVRLYSIIYDAINEIKSAMEGMLSPEVKEEITGTAEIRDVFKITKVGTVAGCYVREGKINRNSKIRVIRDGIVIFTGELGSLKRFKDDVREVSSGYECGLNVHNFNDIKEGDMIESYIHTEVKKTL